MSTEKPFGVALVGVGMVAGTYIDAIAKTDRPLRLTGALGHRQGTAKQFLTKHADRLSGSPVAYPSLADLLADDAVNAVIVTTPPNARHEIVEAAAGRGLPVLMEKPVERTLSAARTLCEICEAGAIPLGVVLQHRARPSALALQKRIKRGAFGRLVAVEITVPWWRPQSYYDEPGRGTYARDGGGVMISQAIHTLDLALQFTGSVNAVNAFTAKTGFHCMESEDFVSAGLRFSNGAVGTFFASTASFPGRTEEIILHFEKATARLQSNLLEITHQDGNHEMIGQQAASGAGADPMAFTSDWHRFIIENFYEHITENKTLFASGRSALRVHQVIDALEKAGQSGTTITLESMT